MGTSHLRSPHAYMRGSVRRACQILQQHEHLLVTEGALAFAAALDEARRIERGSNIVEAVLAAAAGAAREAA